MVRHGTFPEDHPTHGPGGKLPEGTRLRTGWEAPRSPSHRSRPVAGCLVTFPAWFTLAAAQGTLAGDLAGWPLARGRVKHGPPTFKFRPERASGPLMRGNGLFLGVAPCCPGSGSGQVSPAPAWWWSGRGADPPRRVRK
jgi:hypothetical protein